MIKKLASVFLIFVGLFFAAVLVRTITLKIFPSDLVLPEGVERMAKRTEKKAVLDDFPFTLMVGAAKVKITPIVETFIDSNKNGHYDPGEPFEDLNGNGKWDPVWLAGYRGGRFAKGVHDDLWVCSMVMTLKESTILFVSLDLIGYLFDEVTLVKKTIEEKFGIEASHIFIASVHDHSGPDTIGLWGENGKSGKNSDYLKWLREKIVESVGEAIKNKKLARLSFGESRLPNLIHDARSPKVINDLLLSLRATDQEGKTVATLVNYAVHAEVMDERNRFVSADFPGFLRAKLEAEFGGVALFFAGDIGGMQTPAVFFRSFSRCRKFGEKIAKEVIRAQKDSNFVPVESFSVKSSEILFPIENPRFLGAIQNGMFGDTEQFVKKENGKLFLPSEVTAVRLGPAQFVTVPGELFPELGNILRKEMRGDYKFLIGLCGNEIGYIVPKEQWRNNGYEESMSLGPKTAEIVTDSILKLLKE